MDQMEVSRPSAAGPAGEATTRRPAKQKKDKPKPRTGPAPAAGAAPSRDDDGEGEPPKLDLLT